jgi:zinc transport system permease protein
MISIFNNTDGFLLNAILIGMGLVCAMCPLGCIVLWKRLSYFGDAIAHASLLGIVVGLLAFKYMTLVVIVFSVLFAIILFFLRKDGASDAIIIIFSYGFLSLGLFLLVFIPHSNQVDIFSYLFGDILLVSYKDILFVFVCSAALLVWLYFRWKQLLLISINEDLAIVSNINSKKIDLEFMIALAFFVALSVGIVGVFLIVALLVIPASSARNLSSSPEQMLVLSIAVGVLAILGGVVGSYYLDTPSGPSIVLTSVIIFIFSLILKKTKLCYN